MERDGDWDVLVERVSTKEPEHLTRQLVNQDTVSESSAVSSRCLHCHKQRNRRLVRVTFLRYRGGTASIKLKPSVSSYLRAMDHCLNPDLLATSAGPFLPHHLLQLSRCGLWSVDDKAGIEAMGLLS